MVSVVVNRSGLNKRARRYRRAQIQNVGAEAQGRTGDTGIFSAVLYQLSYLSNPLIVGLKGPPVKVRAASTVVASGRQRVCVHLVVGDLVTFEEDQVEAAKLTLRTVR